MDFPRKFVGCAVNGAHGVSGQEKAALVRAAYIDAEALVKRCLHRSHCFWNEQQARPF